MSPTVLILLLICILAVAILYSSVGHGGASGYIAVLALFSLEPASFKPTALVLNILVSSIATISFARAGHFSWHLFWPFAAASIPCSFIGGGLALPPHLYKPLVGVILLFSAGRLLIHKKYAEAETRRPSVPVALVLGALLGLLSGLTGVGGGIFLSPLLLLLKWGKVREVSAVAALFILVNSIAGLVGHLSSLQAIPYFAPFLGIAALIGGSIGAFFGSHRLPMRVIVQSLAVVLSIAGVKMLIV
ncbi:MAG: sulfite exporter TauE/SafE family protein [Thermodesulfobacteriota bacterium]